MLGRLNRLEPDERDLHRQDGPEGVDCGVRHVDAVGEAAADHEDEDVDGDQVDEKHVAAPGGDHVEVGQGAERAPVDLPRLDGLDPQVVSEEHAKDGDALVVVGPRHRAGDVAGDNGDHGGGDEPGARRPQLGGELVGDDGGEGGKEGRQEDADLAHVHRQVEGGQHPVDGGRGHHQARVDGPADDPAQRVPGAIVEPVVEGVEALLGEEPGRPVVEVGVELVDHGLVAQHGEQPDGKRCKNKKEEKKKEAVKHVRSYVRRVNSRHSPSTAEHDRTTSLSSDSCFSGVNRRVYWRAKEVMVSGGGGREEKWRCKAREEG